MAEYYEYDGFNRLTRSVVNGGETLYTYRADGLRVSKQSSGVTTTHMWDGQSIVADLGADSLTTYVRGVNLLYAETGGEEAYYLYNGHGDMVQRTDDSGDAVWYYDYDAFGNEQSIVGQDASLDANPFRYCGEYFDKEMGTVYLRVKYYDPANSRWSSNDSICSVKLTISNGMEIPDPFSLNLYLYCYTVFNIAHLDYRHTKDAHTMYCAPPQP